MCFLAYFEAIRLTVQTYELNDHPLEVMMYGRREDLQAAEFIKEGVSFF